MSDTFRVELVTPNAVIAEVDASELVAFAELGQFGVLPGHTEYLTVLRPGELRLTVSGKAQRFVVGRGFAEVGPEQVTILGDTIEKAEELDAESLEQELAKDEERLRTLSSLDTEYDILLDKIERNRARLSVARGQ